MARAGRRRPPRAICQPGKLEEWKFSAGPPAGAPPTIPYFLRRPSEGSALRLDRRGALRAGRALPASAPDRRRHGLHRRDEDPDRARGDVPVSRRGVRGDPPCRARRAAGRGLRRARPDRLADGQERSRRAGGRVVSNSPDPVKGKIEVGVPPGWPAVAPPAFALEKRNASQTIESRSSSRRAVPLPRRDPDRGGAGRRRALGPLHPARGLRAHPADSPAAVERGRTDRRGPAASASAPRRLRPRRLGRVPGVAPRDRDSRRDALGPQLEHGDLSRYDAIVVGPRAYETDASLVAANGRLLDYVRGGGLLIVQYQQGALHDRQFRSREARDHAPVRARDRRDGAGPDDRSLPSRSSRPPTGSARGIGTAGSRSAASTSPTPGTPAYKPLLAMADPGEPGAAGLAPRRHGREGALRLHGARVFPAVARRCARRLSPLRQPPRMEGERSMRLTILAALSLLALRAPALARTEGVAEFKGSAGRAPGKRFLAAARSTSRRTPTGWNGKSTRRTPLRPGPEARRSRSRRSSSSRSCRTRTTSSTSTTRGSCIP